jgi:hypothetical protein
MAVKVVIENAVLRGSQQEQLWQKVATVYLDGGEEFNIVAPSKATGDALGWLKQFQVRSPTAQGYNPVTDARGHSIIQHVEAELQKRRLDSEIWRSGTNPDGRYVAVQICLRGHVLNVNGTDFERGEHCSKAVSGNPDYKHVSTSFVERQNWTVRTNMRRYTRLSNGFSRKLENHAAATALNYFAYNFIKIHRTLRMSPAMAAGVADRLWSVEDLVALWEAYEQRRAERAA